MAKAKGLWQNPAYDPAKPLTKRQASVIETSLRLVWHGFKRYKRMQPYIPEYFAIDGTPGDFSDTVYRNPQTGQLVTVSYSREFGIFSVSLGDTRGKNKFS